MLLKTAFREIKTSLGRYLAILAIIALGVGFFAGLRVTRTAMISTANHYLKDLAMFDDRILSTLGWTEEDVDAFRKLDGVSAAETPIDPDEDALTLTNRLAELGAETLSRTVQALNDGTAGRTRQDESAVTFAPMLSRELSPMDFTRPARSLHNQVRGLQPWPCAVTELSGATVKVYRTAVGGAVKAAPGTIVRADKTGIEIACGDGLTLRILELQPQNGKRMAVASYLAGHPVQVTV